MLPNMISARHGKEITMEAIVRPTTETPVPVSVANSDIVRSWKDPRYRRRLSAQQLQTLPQHPAGPPTLADQELKAAGGFLSEEDEDFAVTTAFDCTAFTFHLWKACGC